MVFRVWGLGFWVVYGVVWGVMNLAVGFMEASDEHQI